MSYNIDRVVALTSSGLRVHREILLAWKDDQDLRDQFPEINFLGYIEKNAPDADGYVSMLNHAGSFWFSGEGSGRAEDILVEKILPHTRGTADLALIWEGGDSISGLRVEDGRVTPCDVVMTLQPKTS